MVLALRGDELRPAAHVGGESRGILVGDATRELDGGVGGERGPEPTIGVASRISDRTGRQQPQRICLFMNMESRCEPALSCDQIDMDSSYSPDRATGASQSAHRSARIITNAIVRPLAMMPRADRRHLLVTEGRTPGDVDVRYGLLIISRRCQPEAFADVRTDCDAIVDLIGYESAR